MINNIEDTGRKTSLAENITKSPEALRRELGALEDDGVTRRDGESNCTSAKDEGSVPAVQITMLVTPSHRNKAKVYTKAGYPIGGELTKAQCSE